LIKTVNNKYTEVGRGIPLNLVMFKSIIRRYIVGSSLICKHDGLFVVALAVIWSLLYAVAQFAF